MKDNELYTAVQKFDSVRILVIGDLLLDLYMKGKSTRLCPEAPVPVVDIETREMMPGGAANAVCNLRTLGAHVDFCSVVGDDADGQDAIAMLSSLGVDTTGIVVQPGRKTITKSRVMAGSQIITRIDQGHDDDIDEAATESLIERISNAHERCDAVLISDYGKGVVTDKVLEAISTLQSRRPLALAVDSKRLPFFSRLKPSMAKPNYEEALNILGIKRDTDRIRQIVKHAGELFARVQAKVIAVTLDCDGTVILEDGKMKKTIAAPLVKTPHVSGAGDTYISAFLLSYMSKEDAESSAVIATAAASIAINKESTSTCSQAELKSYFSIHTKCVSDLDHLHQICESYRQAGKTLIFTNGCFDILHSGHVSYLHQAKQLGDVLIVGLNNDDSIRRIKGKDRPINALSDRLQVLAGLSSVDHIIAFGDEQDDTPVPVIKIVQPHIFVKGGDYTKDKLPEAETVESFGGEIVFIDHVPDHSTTRIIHKITRSRNGVANVSVSPS